MITLRPLIYTLLLTGVLLMLGCSDSGGGAPAAIVPPPPSPWEPVSRTTDEACSGCESVLVVTESEASHGGGVEILFDPNADDEVTQWNLCVIAITRCSDAGNDLNQCVASASCPETCKTEYQQAVGSAPPLAQQLDALLSVFIDDNASCIPTTGGPQL